MPITRPPRLCCALFAVAWGLGSLVGLGQGNFYQLTDLGTVGAPADKPTGLNQRGVAVGTRSLPGRDGPYSRAFIFTNAIYELGSVGTATFASDVNDHGDTVGWSRLPQAGGRQVERAVLWQDGKHIELGTLGGTNSRAFGINERVDITGAAQTTNGAFHAFLFKQAKLTDLGTLGGGIATAMLSTARSTSRASPRPHSSCATPFYTLAARCATSARSVVCSVRRMH